MLKNMRDVQPDSDAEKKDKKNRHAKTFSRIEQKGIRIRILIYCKRVVEAAGVEPASENHHPWLLHTYPEL